MHEKELSIFSLDSFNQHVHLNVYTRVYDDDNSFNLPASLSMLHMHEARAHQMPLDEVMM